MPLGTPIAKTKGKMNYDLRCTNNRNTNCRIHEMSNLLVYRLTDSPIHYHPASGIRQLFPFITAYSKIRRQEGI